MAQVLNTQQRKTVLLFVCIVIWLMFVPMRLLGEEAPGLYTSKAIRELKADQARKNIPLRVRGQVTYHDPMWGSMYVQDEHGGVLVRLFRGEAVPKLNQWVEVSGYSQEIPGYEGACIGQGRLKLQQMGDDASIGQATVADVLRGDKHSSLVEVQGVIQRVYFNESQRLTFYLADQGKLLQVFVRDGFPEELESLRWSNTKARVRGIIQPVAVNVRTPNKAVLVVNHINDIVLEEAEDTDPFEYPITSIADLDIQMDYGFHIRGQVIQFHSDDFFTFLDSSGAIQVRSALSAPLHVGEEVDLFGFMHSQENRLIFSLMDVRFERPTDETAKECRDLPVLWRIHSIFQMNSAEAKKRYPVRIQGVVTYSHPVWKNFFIQDGNSAIYVEVLPDQPLVRIGQFVEVSGWTDPGGFATQVSQGRVRVLKDAAQLPVPKIASYTDTLSGRLDCQRVEVQGIVQHILSNPDKEVGHKGLRVLTRQGPIEVLFSYPNLDLDSYLDSEIRVHGVYATLYRENRQAYGYRVFSTNTDYIKIEQPAPENLFDRRTTSVSALSHFNPQLRDYHLIKVQGTILGVVRDLAFLRDESVTVVLQSPSPQTISIGQEVEAVGYLSKSGFAPCLEYATVRPTGKTGSLTPISTTIDKALDGTLDANYIRLTARFIQHLGSPEARILSCQSEEKIFNVFLPEGEILDSIETLRTGSLLELKGVCRVNGEWSSGATSMRLFISEVDGIQVLETPPWWNVRRAMFMASIVGVLLLAVFAWVSLLRTQVRRQTSLLQQQHEGKVKLQARFVNLFQQARDMIFTIDGKGLVTSINPAGERLLGYTQEEVLERSLSHFVVPEEQGRIHTVFQKEEGIFELIFLRKDGTDFCAEISTRPLENGSTGSGYQAIARDMTQRKELENHLLHSQKMQAVGQLAGGIAHDFNNLLTVINGYSDLLKTIVEEPSPAYEIVEEIHKAGDRAAALTRQLLAFSRRTITTPRLLSLHQIIQDIERMLGRLLGEPVTLITELWAENDMVRIDRGMMEQVLVNLAVNARDAMPKGGQLTIRTRNRIPDEVCLEVIDTGTGMTEQIKSHLFEPYFTTKPIGQGTGLGLATVLGIVQQANGRIEVESEWQHGTNFIIHFPLQSEPIEEEIMTTTTPAQTPNQETILLVEDDPNVRALEYHILKKEGYKVLLAEHGPQALEILQQHPEKIDLLMTDVVMPEMNGRELAEQVLQLRPEIPVLYLSGYTNDEILRNGISTDEANFLPKPFTPQGLLNKIREVLQQQVI